MKLPFIWLPFIYKGISALCIYKGINTYYCSSAASSAAGNIKRSAPTHNIMSCTKGAMILKSREMTTPN